MAFDHDFFGNAVAGEPSGDYADICAHCGELITVDDCYDLPDGEVLHNWCRVEYEEEAQAAIEREERYG